MRERKRERKRDQIKEVPKRVQMKSQGVTKTQTVMEDYLSETATKDTTSRGTRLE